MNNRTIDAALCARMFLAGAARLEAKKEWINELNVFPVPDGDTGTNMSMTIMSAAKEVAALTDYNMASLAKSMSSGSLRGARGNSGVILSQLLRGFYKGIRDHEVLDTTVLALAFQKATETAYKAVMKPKEGTILTVARAFSDKAAELMQENPQIEMMSFLEQCLDNAQTVLEQTPEMLPVLKEAGVVDSGGEGLVQILRGAFDLYCGKEPEGEDQEEAKRIEEKRKEEENTYCVEGMILPAAEFSKEVEEQLKSYMAENGTDSVILPENGFVKLHVHTKVPGDMISRFLEVGRLSRVKVESLADGHREKVVKAEDRQKAAEREQKLAQTKRPHKEVAFIAVAAGEGLSNIFHDLGVDSMIEGGQTMNPSTEDVLKAIEEVNADHVFVFPNNKNIILAATQAADLTKDCKVHVIPTKTVPQGFAALICYNPDATPEENEQEMVEEITHVQTCSLTYAVRDTHIDDKDIHDGDIMGVGDKGIVAVGTDIAETAVECVKEMADEDAELISLYYGQDVTAEDAEALAEKIREICPQCDVEVNEGLQPIYYYIISVE